MMAKSVSKPRNALTANDLAPRDLSWIGDSLHDDIGASHVADWQFFRSAISARWR
jgi:hypothetical protein